MSKAETLRQSAIDKNKSSLEQLAEQVQKVRDAKAQSVEELSAMLEPLAQALASLSSEAAGTLTEIEHKTRETSASFQVQLESATKDLSQATAKANEAAKGLNQAASRLDRIHYLLAMAIGLFTATLVSVFWTFRTPPAIQHRLDAKAVAEELKPALIEAMKTGKEPAKGSAKGPVRNR